jgi:hypothetical protein
MPTPDILFVNRSAVARYVDSEEGNADTHWIEWTNSPNRKVITNYSLV